MKTWKIKNLAKEPIKFVCKVGLNTKGVILQPNQFCIVEAQQTAFIEAQERRGFISVDRGFDNTKYDFELATVYAEEKLEILKQKDILSKSKIKIAQEEAEKYIHKEE